jgi:hypothetical protein
MAPKVAPCCCYCCAAFSLLLWLLVFQIYMHKHAAAPPMVYIMAPEMPSMMYCPFMRCGMNVTGFTLPDKHKGKHREPKTR